jgi:Na+/H+ antiporter NhaC
LINGSDPSLVILVTSAILTGSIFGDQCSPISDTSVLSSLASKISVVRHVESQFPYALLCAVFSFVAYFPTSAFLSLPSIVFMVLFLALLLGTFYVLSSRVESNDFGIIDRIFYKSSSTATISEAKTEDK